MSSNVTGGFGFEKKNWESLIEEKRKEKERFVNDHSLIDKEPTGGKKVHLPESDLAMLCSLAGHPYSKSTGIKEQDFEKSLIYSTDYFNFLLDNSKSYSLSEEEVEEVKQFSEEMVRCQKIKTKMQEKVIQFSKDVGTLIEKELPEIIKIEKEQSIEQEKIEKLTEEEKKNAKNEKKEEFINSVAKLCRGLEGMPKKAIRGYAEELAKKFKDEKNTISWFPISWNGHHSLIRIEKDRGITIFNGGEPNQFHSSFSFKEKDPVTGEIRFVKKAQLFVKIDCLTKEGKERLGALEFFELLLDMQMRSQLNSALNSSIKGSLNGVAASICEQIDQQIKLPKDLEIKDVHIYQGLAGFIKGTIRPCEDPVSYPSLYLEPQTASASTKNADPINNIKRALYYCMVHGADHSLKQLKSPGSAEKIAYFCERDGLIAFARKLPKSDDKSFNQAVKDYSPQLHKMLLDMMGNLDRAAEKLKKEGLLGLKDIKEQRATFEDIRSRFDEIKKAHIEAAQKKTKDQNKPFDYFVNKDKNKILPNSIIQIESRGKVSDQIQANSAPFYIKTEIHDLAPIPSIEIDKPENVKETLKNWVENYPIDVWKYTTWGQKKKIILERFEQMLASLPIPGTTESNSFWNKVPEEEIEDCMLLLNKLMLLLSVNQEQHPPQATVVFYGFFSILDQLARRADTKGYLKGLKVSHWDLIFEMQRTGFILKNPVTQEKLKEIIAYFDPDWSFETNFSDDEIHRKRSESIFSHCKYQKLFGYQIISFMTLDLSDKDPTYRFYEKFLKEESSSWSFDKELNKRLASTVPHDQRMRILLANLDKITTIPKSFKILHQASLSCSCFSHYKDTFYTPEEIVKSNEDLFYCRFEEIENDKEKPDPRRVLKPEVLKAIKSLKVRKDNANCFYNDRTIINLETDHSPNMLGQELSKNDGIKQNDLIYGNFFPDKVFEDNWRYNRHWERKLEEFSEEERIKLKQMKLELQMLGTDPYDEVQRSASFIATYPEFIKNDYVQYILELHLFKPFRLRSQLKSNPDFAKEFANAIEKAIKHHEAQGDIETCLFLIQLAHQLKLHIAKQKIAIPELILNFPGRILEYARNEKTSYVQARKCYQTLIGFYSTYSLEQFNKLREGYKEGLENKKKELEYFLTAYYSELTLGISKSMDSVNIEQTPEEVSLTVLKAVPILCKNINSNDDLYNRFLALWKKQMNKEDNSLYEISRSGVVTKDGEVLSQIPRSILEDKNLIKICGKELFEITATGKNQFKVKGKYSSLELRVTITETNKIEIFKTINGKEYRYINSLKFEALKDNCPAYFDKKNHYWIEDSEELYKKERLTVLIEKEGKKRLVLSLQNLEDNKEHEVKSKFFNSVLNELKEKRAPINGNKEVTKTVYSPKFKTSLLSILDKERSHVALDALDPSLVNLLKDIEPDSKYINCWKVTSKNLLNSVEMKRRGLSFEIREDSQNDLRLFSREYPGFYLIANDGKNSAFPKNEGWLFLQNEQGKRKYLLPKGIFESTINPTADSFNISLKNRVEASLKEPVSWIEYEIEEGELVHPSIEGRLMLAQLFMAKWDYRKGNELLKSCYSLAPYTEKEEKILAEMMECLEKESHPDAKALLIRLLIMIEENELKFPPIGLQSDEAESYVFKRFRSGSSDFKIEEMVLKYKSWWEEYQQAQSLTPLLKLSDDEELIFLNHVDRCLRSWKKINSRLSDIFISMLFNLFMAPLKERLKSLEKKTDYLGVKTPYDLKALTDKFKQMQPPIKLFLSYLEEVFNQVQKEGYLKEKLPEFFISSDGSLFKGSFLLLYHKAQEGTKEEKEQLKRIIDCHQGCCEEYKGYYEVIKFVFKSPSSYPTLKELKEASVYKDKCRDEFEKICMKEQQQYEKSKEYHAAEKKFKAAKKALEKKLDKISVNSGLFSGIYQAVAFVFKALGLVLSHYAKRSWFYLRHGFWFKLHHWTPISSDIAIRPRKKSKNLLRVDKKALTQLDLGFNKFLSGVVKRHLSVEEKASDKVEVSIKEEQGDSELVKNQIKKENEEIEKFKTKHENEKIKEYRLKDKNSLSGISKELKEKLKTIEEHLTTEKEAILLMANSPSKDLKTDEGKLLHRRGYQKQLTWEELHKLFLQADRKLFRKNTLLSKQEVDYLFKAISDFALRNTHAQQIKRSLKVIKEIESLDSDLYPEKVELLLQNCALTLLQKRAYKLNTGSLDLLMHEFSNGYLFRKNQIKKIIELLKCSGVWQYILALMPTAFGKTKTMTPAVAQELRGKYLVVNAHPISIADINTQDSRNQNEKSYKVRSDAFSFSRSMQMTPETLEKCYQDLLIDIEEGRPLNITSESLRAINNHLLILLEEAEKNGLDKITSQKIKWIGLILRLHRTHAFGFIDESHQTLHPKNRLIYTQGEKEHLPLDEIQLSRFLFNMLSEKEFEDLLDISHNNQALNAENFFKKSEFIKKMIDRLAIELYIANEDKDKFEAFVSGNYKSIEEEKLKVEKREMAKWIANHPKKSAISFIRGQFFFILEPSLKGKVDEQFGLSHNHIDTIEFAIPYEGSNKPKEPKDKMKGLPSQFKNPHETLTKTFITYLHKGLQKKQTAKLFKFLQQGANDEIQTGKTIDETYAGKLFKRLCPDCKTSLIQLTEHEIAELHEGISKNKEAILEYVEKIVAPKIDFYSESFVSTTQNFRSQFARSISWSATPQNLKAHSIHSKFVPMDGVAGQTTHLIYMKGKGHSTIDPKIHIVQSTSGKEVLEITKKLLKEKEQRRAVIDGGGLFRGYFNRDIAREMAEYIKEENIDIDGIVFYDEREGCFLVMNVQTQNETDLSSSTMAPEKRFLFYDQERSYGSDIAQAFDTAGIFLLGQGMTKDSAQQSVGRIKRNVQFKDNLGIEWVIPQPLKEKIFGDKEPTIDGILHYLIANKGEASGEFNYASLKDQMDNELHSAIFDKILGIDPTADKMKLNKEKSLNAPFDVSNALKIYKQSRNQLLTVEKHDSYLMYGFSDKSQETTKALEGKLEKCKKDVEELSSLTSEEKEVVKWSLDRYRKVWEKKQILLPERVAGGSSSMGMECEVLQEVEQETQVLEEIQEPEIPHVRRKASPWKKQIDLFSTGWERTFWNRMGDHFGFLNAMPKLIFRTGKEIAKRISDGVERLPKAPRIGLKFAALPLTAAYYVGVGVKIAALWPIDKIRDLFGRAYCTSYRMDYSFFYDSSKEMNSASKFFSANLLATNNFHQVSTGRYMEGNQKLYDPDWKPCFELLVIQDTVRGKKKLTFIAIDQNDSQFFHKKFQEDLENEKISQEKADARTRKVALVDLRSGSIVVQGKNKFTEDELKSENYHSLMVQSKLMAGEINYTEAELKIVKQMVKKDGDKKVENNKSILRQFLRKGPLKHRPKNDQALQFSELYKTLLKPGVLI